MFLSGLTYTAIKKRLTENGDKTPRGGKWSTKTIKSILSNEKYKGDALLQKYYTSDFLTKKQMVNNGEVPQFYVEGHHKPIVSPEQFERVQREIARRDGLSHRYTGGSIFSSKLICGECGCVFGSKVWHSTDKYRRVIWQCNGKYGEKKECRTPHLTEDGIKEAFVKAMGILWEDREAYIEDIELLKPENAGLEAELSEAEASLTALADKVQEAIYENARTAQDQREYEKRYNALVERFEAKQVERDGIEKRLGQARDKTAAINEFIKSLQDIESPTQEFSERLWGGLVENVAVGTDGSLTFNLKCGMKVKVG